MLRQCVLVAATASKHLATFGSLKWQIVAFHFPNSTSGYYDTGSENKKVILNSYLLGSDGIAPML